MPDDCRHSELIKIKDGDTLSRAKMPYENGILSPAYFCLSCKTIFWVYTSGPTEDNIQLVGLDKKV